MKNITSLLLVILSISLSFGQEPEPKKFDVSKDKIKDYIPSLESLLDSAVNYSSKIEGAEAEINKRAMMVKSSKRLWTNNLGVSSDVRYGSYDNINLSDIGGIPTTTVTAKLETRYGMGGYIRFPLYPLVNRRNEINIAEAELDIAKATKGETEEAIREEVIKRYNDLIFRHESLKISSKNKITSSLQMQMAEKEFTDGLLSIVNLARVSEIYARALINYEDALATFMTSYMLLEEITGVNFNLL